MESGIKFEKLNTPDGRIRSKWTFPVGSSEAWADTVRDESRRWAVPGKAAPLSAIISELIQNAGKALLKKAWSAKTPTVQQSPDAFRSLLADDILREQFLSDAGDLVLYVEQRREMLRIVVANPGSPSPQEWEKIRIALGVAEEDVMESAGTGEGGGIGLGLILLLLKGLGVRRDALRVFENDGWTVSRVNIPLRALQ